MTINEMINGIREPDNWTDEFFTDIEPVYMQHLNTVRNTLVKDGLWDRFDKAFSEWQRPGQAAIVAAPKVNKSVCDQGKARPLKQIKPIEAITASALDAMNIPPIEWLVDRILPVGISMIGAPSKYYKSYMALDLCISICNGDRFLNFNTHKHACLYFDLESTKRRPKNRLDQILGNAKKPDNLYIITGEDDPGRIGEGFEDQIEYQLRVHPEIKLIIVDVFQLIRRPKRSGQDGYERDYEDFKVLKKIADSHSVGLMLIHHTRKMKDPNDVFNELSGSVAIMGALDCSWVISKDDRFANEATLHITGRDLSSEQYKIRFNRQSFRWEYVGTSEDIENQRRIMTYKQHPIRNVVVKLVDQGGGHWEGSASEIQKASAYIRPEIYDDVRKIGNFLSDNEDLFQSEDYILIDNGRNKKGRKWIFDDVNPFSHDTNDTNDTNDTHDTHDTIQQKLDI